MFLLHITKNNRPRFFFLSFVSPRDFFNVFIINPCRIFTPRNCIIITTSFYSRCACRNTVYSWSEYEIFVKAKWTKVILFTLNMFPHTYSHIRPCDETDMLNAIYVMIHPFLLLFNMSNIEDIICITFNLFYSYFSDGCLSIPRC